MRLHLPFSLGNSDPLSGLGEYGLEDWKIMWLVLCACPVAVHSVYVLFAHPAQVAIFREILFHKNLIPLADSFANYFVPTLRNELARNALISVIDQVLQLHYIGNISPIQQAHTISPIHLAHHSHPTSTQLSPIQQAPEKTVFAPRIFWIITPEMQVAVGNGVLCL